MEEEREKKKKKRKNVIGEYMIRVYTLDHNTLPG
jgi:hypothetical protein